MKSLEKEKKVQNLTLYLTQFEYSAINFATCMYMYMCGVWLGILSCLKHSIHSMKEFQSYTLDSLDCSYYTMYMYLRVTLKCSEYVYMNCVEPYTELVRSARIFSPSFTSYAVIERLNTCVYCS